MSSYYPGYYMPNLQINSWPSLDGYGALVYPGAHILTKNNGEVVTVTWRVTNGAGAAAGFAHLILLVGSQPTATSAVTSVAGGSFADLTVSLTLTGQPTGADAFADVTMVERTSTGAFVRNIASHGFTVRIPAAAAVLTADPLGPTIT